MSEILARNLSVSTRNALKKLAEQHHRSLQAEVKEILEVAVIPVKLDRVKLVKKIRLKLSSQQHSDSAELIAEDRK